MGAWDITMRESDYKLDLLGTVAKAQLKQMDFSAFHVTEAIELLQQDILQDGPGDGGVPAGEAGLLHQCQFSARLHPCGAPDRGVSGGLLPHGRAGCHRIRW